MMNIIAASRSRGQAQSKPNTFIVGIQNDITTASDLASYLGGVNQSNIFNFQLFDTGVSAFIDSGFSFPRMTSNLITQKITRILYLGENNININDSPGFDSNVRPKMKTIAFPNALFNAGDRTFFESTPLGYFFTPKTTQIGQTLGDDEVFNKVLNSGNAVFSQAAETANSGSPDGDIQDLISKNWNVTYSQDQTKPTAATISANTIGSTYLELNVSKPTHVNTLKYALVFVDGFFQDVYDISSVFATNLQEQTSYDIKVIIADEYFNISPYSNTINVTTTIMPALFQNAVAYYKQNELSGQTLDLINAYTGVDVGTIVKDGEWYDYGTNESYVQISDNDDFSFTNGTSATDFVIKTEVIFDGFNSQNRAWLVSKRELITSGVQGWQLILFSGNLQFDIWDDANNNITINTPFTPAIGQKYILGVTFINNELRLFIDGARVATLAVTTPVNFVNSISPVKLGNETFITRLNLVGRQKETVFIKGKGWTDGEISDNYNNGNGTTI